MYPYISLAILVIIIIWQGHELMKYESKFDKIRETIGKTIQNEDTKTNEELLREVLENVSEALRN